MNNLSTNNLFYIDIANWLDNIAELKKIRTSVFIDEQNVPIELEWDDLDESCTHFIVRSNNNAIATARLSTKGQIGRMAVLPDYRNIGIGTSLLLKLLSHARDSGHSKLYLHAQTNAIYFYEKHGFNSKGEEFEEAGIPHKEMYKYLD